MNFLFLFLFRLLLLSRNIFVVTYAYKDILEGLTWKMDFTAFGRGYLREEQLDKMHRYTFLFFSSFLQFSPVFSSFLQFSPVFSRFLQF
jgi:hypothetical protein